MQVEYGNFLSDDDETEGDPFASGSDEGDPFASGSDEGDPFASESSSED